ncbi:single-stranded DNA-binding protein [Anaerovibrio sp.]|uniref:single-stranded DNA-binding protein n=1 Tax=Anaerovibrio sp. TaxID=1872532 RepID=UPI003890FBEA
MMFNLTIHSGYLAAAPRTVESNGTKRVYLTVACNRRRRKGAEEPKPDYIPYVVFNKLADSCAANLEKGQEVFIRGHQHSGKYKDKWYTSNVVDEIRFGAKSHRKDNSSQADNTAVPSAIPGTEMDVEKMDIPDGMAKEMAEEAEAPIADTAQA